MEQYFLLRDNRESGPYSVKELRAKTLVPTDLVWVEGKSDSWKHGSEIAELSGFVKERERKLPPRAPAVSRFATDPAPAQEQISVRRQIVSTEGSTAPASPEIDLIAYDPGAEELRKMPWAKVSKKKAWRRQLNIGANLIGLVTFVMGVMMAAVMVKKAVDSFDPPEQTAVLSQTSVQEDLPMSATTHAALRSNGNSPMAETVTAPLAADTSTTLKAEKKTTEQQVKVKPLPAKVPVITSTTDTGSNLPSFAKSEVKDGTDGGNDEANRPEKPAAVPKAELQVAANEYKVGMFGGIKNLQLSVTNPSSLAVEKAMVEVDYLKPNGSVIHTQTVEIKDIAPGETKKVAVPDNGRGVSVRYRILNN